MAFKRVFNYNLWLNWELLICVIDENGEDYAYATERFYPIALPETIERALLVASEQMVV